MDRKEQIIELWRQCFNDSEAFIQLFFDKVYKEENALTIEEDGKIVSALQMLPYTMNYYGTEISVSYIYGACTAPNARNKGWMRKLLHKAFEVMKQRGVELTVLIPAEPWLFGYYSKQGYTESFLYKKEIFIDSNLPEDETTVEVTSTHPMDTDTIYQFFDRKMRNRSCCMLHTADDFNILLQDLYQEGGHTLIAYNQKQSPVGLLFLYPTDNGNFTVREMLYDDENIKTWMLRKAALYNKTTPLSYFTMANNETTAKPLGMARIINASRMLPLWIKQHPESPISIAEMQQMEVSALTSMLLNSSMQNTYMSLMLN